MRSPTSPSGSEDRGRGAMRGRGRLCDSRTNGPRNPRLSGLRPPALPTLEGGTPCVLQPLDGVDVPPTAGPPQRVDTRSREVGRREGEVEGAPIAATPRQPCSSDLASGARSPGSVRSRSRRRSAGIGKGSTPTKRPSWSFPGSRRQAPAPPHACLARRRVAHGTAGPKAVEPGVRRLPPPFSLTPRANRTSMTGFRAPGMAVRTGRTGR